MNDTIRTMRAHRSIRRYTEEPVSPEHLRESVRAGQSAATSSNVQSYSVILVTNPETRAQFATLAGPQDKIKDCGTFLVFCADTRRHRLICEQRAEPYANTFENFMVAIIDATLFAQNTTLALESLNYGTCYIGGIRNDLPTVHKLLNLPKGVYALYGLCAGTSADTPIERPRLATDAVMMTDTYADDATLMRGVADYDAVYTQYLKDRGSEPGPTTTAWSDAMLTKNTSTKRDDVGPFYATNGAPIT